MNCSQFSYSPIQPTDQMQNRDLTTRPMQPGSMDMNMGKPMGMQNMNMGKMHDTHSAPMSMGKTQDMQTPPMSMGKMQEMPGAPMSMGRMQDMQTPPMNMGRPAGMPNPPMSMERPRDNQMPPMTMPETGRGAGMRMSPPMAGMNLPSTTVQQPGMQTPTTVESPYFTAGFLRNFIGKTLRVEFLIGTSGALVDRTGDLMEVGASYIVLKPSFTDDLLMCDLYSIKFVTIYG